MHLLDKKLQDRAYFLATEEGGIFMSSRLKGTAHMIEQGWVEKVTVVLHRVPEGEGFEGGFEAVTMADVPHRVSVAGIDKPPQRVRWST